MYHVKRSDKQRAEISYSNEAAARAYLDGYMDWLLADGYEVWARANKPGEGEMVAFQVTKGQQSFRLALIYRRQETR